MKRRRALLGIVLGLLVVTAGCSGGAGGSQLASGGDEVAAEREVEATSTPQATPAAAEAEDAGGGAGGEFKAEEFQVQQRAIIRTGRVELVVEDFDAAERNLTRTVEGYGGFVSDSRVEVHRVDNETYKTGMLVLRVPREDFSAMMAAAKAVGEVRSASTESRDVTEQLVDIDARLKNLRAERERLRQLYRNASDTEDILAVERRLSEVQGQIERLKARRKELRRQVALSTIRVELREPRPEPDPFDPDRWYETPVVAAFLESVDGVVTTLRALVVAGAYALPYLLVFGLPVVGAAYALRRRRQRRIAVSEPDGGAPTDADAEDEDEDGA